MLDYMYMVYVLWTPDGVHINVYIDITFMYCL